MAFSLRSWLSHHGFDVYITSVIVSFSFLFVFGQYTRPCIAYNRSKYIFMFWNIINLNYPAHLPIWSFPILARQNIEKGYIIQTRPGHRIHVPRTGKIDAGLFYDGNSDMA